MDFIPNAHYMLRDFRILICGFLTAGQSLAHEKVHDAEVCVRRRGKNDELNVMETQDLLLPVTWHD
jgi:hypothetical protein